MKLSTLSMCMLYTLGNVIEALPTQNKTETAASLQIAQWQKQYNQYVEATVKTRKSGCTSDNIVYRQEWGALSKQSRLDYIKAVECIQQKSPISPPSDVPGARSRFDDFSATHIMQSPYVHFGGLFYHFHRYFIWRYEKALQEECGYKGTQPYWDWTLSWQNPQSSSVFDGSPTSMGSNGKAIPHGATDLSAFGINLHIPPGTGGGCVYSGPFTNYSVNLGPVAFEPKDGDNGLGYNPRCLTRDISTEWSNHTKPTDVAAVISTCPDLGCFDTAFEAIDGVHAGGHFTIGAIDLDAFASSGDPAFYLHHAQVDRVWTLWQSLNVRNRTNQVFGTGTAFNVPPSPNLTLDTEIDFGFIGPKQRLGSLSSSVDGPFCYAYI